MEIANNIRKIRRKIKAAEKKYHREENSARLIAVSKTRKIEEIISAINENQRHFGENYCQEAIEKIRAITEPGIVWHFIGPIQSNKTNQIARYFNWVHTVDRIKIARRLDKMRPENMPPLNVCIQVNTSGEITKSGISIEEIEDFIDEIKDYKHIKVRGLMSLPEIKSNIDEQRDSFLSLKKVFNQLKKNKPELDTLSIGTTLDMEAAIAEGATFVRIGTAIFGSRNI
ncbi:MAG: YggS family pyridoxal phosphate-dependent enzyme [Pseudomonadota bacterium]|nr:YggS family pyridoxal phosphate-dependent enzyme [Pseudomonadota bacterium]|tara:strand:+ start:794 stop:1477 length:684 start_codon:yes stop_codon:yes gene_type:complete